MDINLKDYVKIVMKVSRKANSIRVGHFYTFSYNFKKTYPPEELKFYDYFPLVFVYELERRNNQLYIRGLNFHHLPIRSRVIWYNRLLKIYGENFENNERMVRLSYPNLFSMFKKSVYGIRQYKITSIKKLMKIPHAELKMIMEIANNTYFDATLAQVSKKYSLFIPPRHLK